MKEIMIEKADGTREPFDEAKLRVSLQKAGATDSQVKDVLSHVEPELKDGDTTKDIYIHAHDLLKKIKGPVAARYSLRRALEEMGPSGFPFEDFIAELYKARGYGARTRITVPGKCVPHEVDCYAWNDKELDVVEAKFKNKSTMKSDLKVVLYVKARLDDLHDTEFDCDGESRKVTRGVLITNTKFSKGAIDYAKCTGVDLIGWTYPSKGNLQDLIDETGLHPLTCLSTLSKGQKTNLLQKNVVLCRNLKADPELLREAGLSEEKIKEVLEESHAVCN